MSGNQQGVTAELVQFVCESGYDDLPDHVVNEAKRSILNWLGVTIGAIHHESVDIMLKLASEAGGAGQVAVLGRKERVDALNGALINGMSSHIFDFDDTHLRTIIHPSAPVAPAALALAEWKGGSGKDVLAAFALGVEGCLRIGNSICPEHYAVGWHGTGTLGVFGSALASSKMLGNNELATRYAVGLAATQASSIREMFGTMTKPYHPGKAAMDGLRGALIAGWGFTSSEQGIEAPRGYANVASTKFDPAEITGELGSRWELLKNAYKPYPCGVVIHPVIDAALGLREKGVTADNVESITAEVNPHVQELTSKRTPRTGLEGKFSVFHSVAAAIVRGKVGQAEYSDEAVHDPEIIAVRDRTDITVVDEIREDECRIHARMKDGSDVDVYVEFASGSIERPLTDQQLDDKFTDLVTPILGESRAAELIAIVRDFENQPDMSALVKAATP
jgi:2-methylcitrate dehydratase PrpD